MKRLPAALAITALALVGCERGGGGSGIAACEVVADVEVADVLGEDALPTSFEPERNVPAGSTGCAYRAGARGITVFAVPGGDEIFERGQEASVGHLVDVDDVSGPGFRAYWSGSDRTFVSLFVLAGDQYAEVRFEGIAAPGRQRLGAHAIDRLTGRGSPS